MSTRPRFPMAELVDRTGIPRATIHHYARAGLLPDPERESANRFLYDERHVRSLRLIRLLRERRGLSLDEISEVLPELLGRDGEEAFRPEMWDAAVGLHLEPSARVAPQRRLLDAAVDRFSSHGYAETNVDEICDAASIAKGSFYRHYPSKQALFFAAAVDVAERAVRELDPVVVGGALDVDATASQWADLIRPHLPILLDLLSGSVQGRPGYAEALREVVDAVLRGIATDISDVVEPQSEGGTSLQVVQRGIGKIVEAVLTIGPLKVSDSA